MFKWIGISCEQLEHKVFFETGSTDSHCATRVASLQFTRKQIHGRCIDSRTSDMREFEPTARNPGNANADVTFACCDSQKLRLRLRFQVAGCLHKLAIDLTCSGRNACRIQCDSGLTADSCVVDFSQNIAQWPRICLSCGSPERLDERCAACKISSNLEKFVDFK